MTAADLKKEIESLSLPDKLLLVEDIWDSIAQSNNQIPFHEWQKNELDVRYADFKNEKIHLHDWKSVHEELREKYK